MHARTKPSVRSWRTTRAGLAPSAERTASSRWREPARVSIRLATSAQPMSSTIATAPMRTTIIRRLCPTTSSMNGHIGIDSCSRHLRENRWIPFGKRFHDRRELGAGLRHRHAGLQPRDDAVVVLAAEPLPLERRKRDREVERPRLVVDSLRRAAGTRRRRPSLRQW